MQKYLHLCLLVCLSFIACNERASFPENGIIDIHPDFQSYVDAFVEEANTRGISIDFSDTGLTMQFSTLPLGTAAQCQEVGDARSGSHTILFDENLWAIAAPERKAFLVFHELGHCELGRLHQNDQFPNGDWQSMMQGTILEAPLSEKNQGRPVVFSGFRKDYYLDELFGINTSTPAWSSFEADFIDLLPSQTAVQFDTSNTNLLQEKFDLPSSNFALEITLQRTKNTGDLGLKYGTLNQSYLFKITDEQEVLIERAGQTPNEIDFFNGGAIILISPYRLFFCNDLSIDDSNVELAITQQGGIASLFFCLLYTSPSPRDQRGSRMPSSA